jgi:hypothetical protein
MIVNRTIKPEQRWTDEEGDHVCPPLVNWLIICPDHQCYTTVTVQESDLIELRHEILENFIHSLVMMAKLDMESRDCFHDIPPLELSVSHG